MPKLSIRDIDLTNKRVFIRVDFNVPIEHGRITDGVIIDNETRPNGQEIAFYVYTLNGVDFESSEILDDEQCRFPLKYAPGAKVAVRYDPKNQGNSMLV